MFSKFWGTVKKYFFAEPTFPKPPSDIGTKPYIFEGKVDVVENIKHIGVGVGSVVKGVLTGILGVFTPTLIWVTIILVLGLVFWKKIEKVIT